MITRRNIIKGLVSFVAAPAIIRVAPLMAIKPVPLVEYDFARDAYTEISMGYQITRKAINDYLYKEAFNPDRMGLSWVEMLGMTQQELDRNLLS